MNNNDPMVSAADQDFKRLDYRVDELVRLVERLHEENRTLRARLSSLVNEKASLIERNEEARLRVEAMINRLKEMEQGA